MGKKRRRLAKKKRVGSRGKLKAVRGGRTNQKTTTLRGGNR